MHKIKFPMILTVILPVLICIVSAYSQSRVDDGIVFLRLEVKKDTISVLSKEHVAGILIQKKNESMDGAVLYTVSSSRHTELRSGSMPDPLKIPYDYADENGILSGGIKELDNAVYDLRLPCYEDMSHIFFFKKEADGKRGMQIGDASLGNVKRGFLSEDDERASREAKLLFIQGDSTQKRCDYVVLSEGYTQSELDNGKFLKDLKTGVDFHFKQTPFLEYKNHWNVWAISIASSKSGLGGYFGSTQSGRLIYCPDLTKARNLLKQLKPTYVLSCILVNTTVYGGAGSDIAVASINVQCGELIAHETGHGAFLLGDEYDYAGAQPAENPNTTKETDRTKVRWKEWILSTTPCPTPETTQWDAVIGVFEGACYMTKGWYRPKNNCKMKAFGYPFCSVCQEATVATVYNHTTAYMSYSPTATAIDFNAVPDKKLTVVPRQTTINTVKTLWYVNGTPQKPPAEVLDLTKISLKPGSNKIKAVVVDSCPFVKTPKNLPVLSDSIEWNVQYSGTGIAFENTLTGYSFSTLRSTDNASIRVRYSLPGEHTVTILLYSVKGVCIGTWEQKSGAGMHSAAIIFPRSLSTGIYVVQCAAGSFKAHTKIEIVQ